MALVLADRVKETTATAGTGTVTLLGASTGFQSFAVIGNSNTTFYCIAAQSGSEWEVGIGTYTSSGTTLARTTVLSNSSGTQPSALSFSAGTKDVFVTYPSSRSIYADGTTLTATNSSVLPVASGGTGQTSFTANYIHYGSFSTSANFTYDGTTLAVAGAASGTAVSATSSGSTATILATDTGVNGANIKLVGNGATTPNKFIRAQSGIFQIINSAYSAAIFNLSDAGAISSSTWNGSTVGVAYGGTGIATTTAYSVVFTGTTATGAFQASAGPGTSGQVLTSNGAGALPTFKVPSSIILENAQTISSNYTITAGNNGLSAGPVTVNTGVTVTVGTGQTWVVI